VRLRLPVISSHKQRSFCRMRYEFDCLGQGDRLRRHSRAEGFCPSQLTYWERAGAPPPTICIALIMTSRTLSSVHASEHVKS